jgi:hypothetical protein
MKRSYPEGNWRADSENSEKFHDTKPSKEAPFSNTDIGSSFPLFLGFVIPTIIVQAHFY